MEGEQVCESDRARLTRRCRFENEECLEKRQELQHHRDVALLAKEEELLRAPVRYMKLEPLGGFDR
jgi:hypothetical protein